MYTGGENGYTDYPALPRVSAIIASPPALADRR